MRNVIIWHWLIKNLMDTRRRNDVDATSLRRIDVVTTTCACWEFGPPCPPPPPPSSLRRHVPAGNLATLVPPPQIPNRGPPPPPQYSKPSYAYDYWNADKDWFYVSHVLSQRFGWPPPPPPPPNILNLPMPMIIEMQIRIDSMYRMS